MGRKAESNLLSRPICSSPPLDCGKKPSGRRSRNNYLAGSRRRFEVLEDDWGEYIIGKESPLHLSTPLKAAEVDGEDKIGTEKFCIRLLSDTQVQQAAGGVMSP